jgi:hypothetical protein
MFPLIALRAYGPEIGDMDKSIVEGCEDSGYTKHQLTSKIVSSRYILGELGVSYRL